MFELIAGLTTGLTIGLTTGLLVIRDHSVDVSFEPVVVIELSTSPGGVISELEAFSVLKTRSVVEFGDFDSPSE